MKCHGVVRHAGQHATHLAEGLSCKSCHKPHTRRITAEQATKDCVSGHEYRDPGKFIAMVSRQNLLAVHEVAVVRSERATSSVAR